MGDLKTTNRLNDAVWAMRRAEELSLLDPEDSSVQFVNWDVLDDYLEHLSEAFGDTSIRHGIAIKTQPHPAVLAYIAAQGFGLEAASIEEVKLAVAAKAPFIIFDSPVKRKIEIEYCQQLDVPMLLNVNCLEELERLPAEPNFEVGIRINPQLETDAPEIFRVASDESKFGVPWSQRDEVLQAIEKFPVTALHVHCGSSMKAYTAQLQAAARLAELANEANKRLAALGTDRRIDTIDIGGGLSPEVLTGEKSRMQSYASALAETVGDSWGQFKWLTEFGQWVHFYTGFACSEVEYALQRGGGRVAFVHLGADFLMRDAYAKPRGLEFHVMDGNGIVRASEPVKHDVAGPLCFAGDYIGRDVMMPAAQEGDRLLIMNTGSNAHALWSRHCSRDIPKLLGVSKRRDVVEILSPRFNPFV